ncbi:recombinase family protein [Streptomyces nanhaiensis]|uniref:recombinase family protein n=1 Tax=Streptomyces nanhaiensis TaxID=679319 RepID=UPI00399CE8E8
MHTDPPPMPTRAIIYCRISRDREGAGLGVERQREDCEALAQQLGVEVVAVYSDNDLSAYSGKPRPGYESLLEDLRAGKADTVLAWHTDRLHRSPAELETYIDVCEPRGVQTRTVKAGTLDLSTATGRMIARQLGVQARYEVERMVERQKRTRDQMAARGVFFGGRRPFGYEADGVTVREEEAALIREAADAVLAGASLHSIAADWNRRGVLTSTGRQWKGPEVREMLLRPRNAGIVRHRGREAGPAGWPAVLDEPLWRSVVAVLSDPERRTTPGNERRYLGSGLYLCGVCADGTTMRCTTSSTRAGGVMIPSYGCRLRKHLTRRTDPLDDHVVLTILDRVSGPDAAGLLARQPDPVDVAGAQADMRQARAILDQLAAALGAGEMDMQEWRVASQAAKGRLERAEQALAGAVRADPVAALVAAQDPAAAWNGLDLSRQRAVLDALMTVTVLPAPRGRRPGGSYFDPGAVRIDWKR